MKNKEWVRGVDYPAFMTEESLQMLKGGYLEKWETPKMAIKRASDKADEILRDMAQEKGVDISFLGDLGKRFFNNIWNNKFCPSSPMWTNMGSERGLPISCYGSSIADSIAGISYTLAENMNMSAFGGGTSADFSRIRAKGKPVTSKGISEGAPYFAEMFEEMIKKIDQGELRKGAFAGFLNADHEDFYEWMEIREKKSHIQRMTYGVIVDDEFMERLLNRDEETMNRQALILKCRSEKGLPYIFYKGNANKNKPECYADDVISHTNLCTEIMLPDSDLESFVCCVASMNCMQFDVWGQKDDDSVFLAILFMEAVMEDFIQKIEKTNLELNSMKRALRFAKRHRALGLGVLGLDSYFQSKNVAYESSDAMMINGRMFAVLKEKSLEASKCLAELFGETEKTVGTGRRHTTLLAVAPTTGNASIAGGWSPSTEKSQSNFFMVKLANGKFIRKNKFLDEALRAKGLSEEKLSDIWDKIMKDGGSCQAVVELTEHEKNVFKTMKETNQMHIVNMASQRQFYIDQGQSLNLSFPPETPAKEINAIYIKAWQTGIKALYYQRSESILRTGLNVTEDVECLACEG